MSEPVLAFAKLDLSIKALNFSDDLEVARSHEWISHVNTKCYQGGWDVLPLVVPQEHLNNHIILQSFSHNCESPWVESQYLKRLPSIRALIARFECDVLSVRLMRLHANSSIKPHRDAGLSIEASSQARIHIPLEISPEVQFQVDGVSVPMAANSVWYINADAVHSVKNSGDTPRVNLVVDCNVNEWLFKLIMASKEKTYCCRKVS